MIEKSYEERLNSLKKGCIILGILHIVSIISGIQTLKNNKTGLFSLLFTIVLLILLYLIYTYTKKRNPAGPVIENVYGVLLLVEGVLLCFSIIGVPFGIIYFVMALNIFKEAKYFKQEFENSQESDLEE